MRYRGNAGFTMLELLAALAILAALVAIAIPSYEGLMRRSRTAEAKTFLSAAQSAEKSFYISEGSYTACLGKIMSSSDSTNRFFSIGYSQFSVAPQGCGTNYSSSCYQACFTSKCSVTCAPGSNATFFMATNYGSTPTASIDQLYNLSTSNLYTDWSFIQAKDFLIIAAAQDGLVAKNNWIRRALPEAYADSGSVTPKVYAIDPTGEVTSRVAARSHISSSCCNNNSSSTHNSDDPSTWRTYMKDGNGNPICSSSGNVMCTDGSLSPSCKCY